MVDTSMKKIPNSKIGDRLECFGYFGTIKYVGPVEGTTGIWLGVDWDNPDRGKHDGRYNEKKYFTAKHQKSGSFVRPERVRYGQSIIDSISSKYGHTDDEFTSKVNQQNQLKFQKGINAPFVELVGFDKIQNVQSDFNSLKIVVLRLQNVSSSGPPNSLNEMCPLIEELDLSKNLINSWYCIFDICAQLNHLKWLCVSENLMEIPENYTDFNFPNVTTLICGSMHLNWVDVLKIIKIFPNLEEFRAPNNNIHNLDLIEGDFSCLKMLDIEGNAINQWSEICKLDVAKKLEYLIIQNVGLSSIELSESGDKVAVFRNLRRLCLVNNQISDWKSIGELNKLENLEDLKINRNPIIEMENKQTTIQLLIAKIASLKILNGAKIDDAERRGAEYDYIKKYSKEYLSIKDPEKRTEFFNLHNRYFELIKKYGEPEESEFVPPSKISSTLISINLVFGDKSITKNVPLSISVQKLIMLVQKLFRLKERPELVYISGTDANITFELDDEMKELGLYSVQSGDQIVVKI